MSSAFYGTIRNHRQKQQETTKSKGERESSGRVIKEREAVMRWPSLHRKVRRGECVSRPEKACLRGSASPWRLTRPHDAVSERGLCQRLLLSQIFTPASASLAARHLACGRRDEQASRSWVGHTGARLPGLHKNKNRTIGAQTKATRRQPCNYWPKKRNG